MKRNVRTVSLGWGLGGLWIFVACATPAHAEDVSRRGFLLTCAAVVGLGAAADGAPAPRPGQVAVEANLDIDELGLEAVGQTVKALLIGRGWVSETTAKRTEARADALRDRLQWDLWAQLQRRALAVPETARSVTVDAEADVALPGGGSLRVTARFRLALGGYETTDRGRERSVEGVRFLGGGEDRRRVDFVGP